MRTAKMTGGMQRVLTLLVFWLFTQPVALFAATPSLTTPATSNIGANQATLTLQSSTTGTGYFTLLSGTGTACGTGSQVKAGQDSSGKTPGSAGSLAVAFGSLPLTANTVGSYTVRNLLQSRGYTVCFTADDGTNLQAVPATVNLTTAAPATYAVPGWGVVGSPGFTPLTAADTSLAFAPDGTPWVAYDDFDSNWPNLVKATVMKYDGNGWITVGGSSISPGRAKYTSLAFAPDGTPYLAYMDSDNFSSATVKKFNGTQWVTVGSPGISGGTVQYTSLALAPDGTPYVAYMDYNNSSKATVMKYNGSNWVAVGSPGFSAGEAYFVSLAIAPDGTLYVAVQDNGNATKAVVRKFDGTNWVVVGGAAASPGYAWHPSLAISADGTPYVAYGDTTNSSKVTVAKYDGANWVTVGNAVSSGSVYYNSLVFGPDGAPYLAYRDSGAKVMKFDGSNWVLEVNIPNSADNGYSPSLAFAPDGAPHLSFRDGGNGNRGTVMRLASAATLTTGAAGAITSSGATLNGTVNANGFPATVVFDYGIDTGYALGSTAATPGSVTGASDTPVTASITGLACNTTYHYLAKGVNSGGTATGLDQTFTTPVCPQHTVTYNGNGATGGSVPVDSSSYATNATVTVAGAGSLTKAGYILSGWNTAVNGSGTGYAATGSATFAMGANYANVTLYAQWTPSLANPVVSGLGAGQATLSLTSGTTGRGYFTLLPGSNTPCGTGAQVRLGQNSGGNPAYRQASLFLAADVAGSFTFRNLTPATPYTVCFTADDGSILQPVPATTNLTTTAMPVYNTPAWTAVGSPGFTSDTANYTSLSFAPDGTPHVAYVDASGLWATVMKYDGSTWTSAGGYFSYGQIDHTSLAFAPDGTPYLAFYDSNGSIGTLAKYDGGDFVTVGGWSGGESPSLAISPGGTPYVAFRDTGNASSRASVTRYDSSQNNLSIVDVNYNFGTASADAVTYPSMAIAQDSTLYVAYQDAANGSKATVVTYDGSTWNPVGNAGFSAGQADYTSLAIAPDGTPYLAYQDYGNGQKATVMKFDGSTWVAVGSVGFSAGQADYLSLAVAPDGAPIVAYQDYGNGRKATVMKFDGNTSTWVAVGSAGFSAGQADYTSLAIAPNGGLSLAYKDNGNGGKATVMRLMNNTGTTVAPSVNPSVFGQTVTFTATVTPASATGTVTFMDGSSTLGSATLASGSATFNTAALGAGDHSITAVYGGDGNNSGSSSAIVTQTINKAGQAITFNPPTATYGDAPITLSASAPGGPVTFAVASGPGNLTGKVLTITGAGTIVITASQAGNANYSAATGVQRTIVVAKATATVTLTPASLSATYDGTAKSVSATTVPAGKSLTFIYNGSPTPPVNAGSYSVVATVNDANYQGSASGTLVIAYNPSAPTLTVSTLADNSVTNNATLNVSGTASGINGIASVTINGTAVTVAGDGTFSQAITLQPGTNTVTTIATDNAGLTATDRRTITLDTTAPVITITSSADNSTLAALSVTITGTVDKNATVQATVNSGSPQSAAMDGTGFTVTLNVSEGSNTITVTATDLAGNTASVKRTIVSDTTKPTLAITDPAQDITTSQATLTISGTVSDALTAVTVSIACDGKTYAPPVANGAFQQQITFTGAKQYAITATATDQAGNSATTQRNVIYVPVAASPIGDINGDGTVDVADALLALQMAIGLTTPTPVQLAAGDVAPLVNGKPAPDGVVDISDAMVILERAVGLLTW